MLERYEKEFKNQWVSGPVRQGWHFNPQVNVLTFSLRHSAYDQTGIAMMVGFGIFYYFYLGIAIQWHKQIACLKST